MVHVIPDYVERTFYWGDTAPFVEADVDEMSAYLLDKQVLMVGWDGPQATLNINCSDMFGPAADCEPIATKDIPELFTTFVTENWIGVEKFIRSKRKMPSL